MIDYYSAIKKNKILPFVTAWVGLEVYMLSESQVKTNTISYDFTFMWNLKKINEQSKNRLIYTENKLRVARWEGVWGLGEKGADVQVLFPFCSIPPPPNPTPTRAVSLFSTSLSLFCLLVQFVY